MPFKKLPRLSPFHPSWREFKKKKKDINQFILTPNITIALWNNSFPSGSMAMILEQLSDFLSGWKQLFSWFSFMIVSIQADSEHFQGQNQKFY